MAKLKAQTGTASVGSQSLTGIASPHKLRNDPQLAGASVVWPFETGWVNKAKWLPKHVFVLHAEIYPSVRDPMPDEIKDRGQVRAMWQWARDLDEQNLLWCEFCRPVEIETGSKEDLATQLTEGWIPRLLTDCETSIRDTAPRPRLNRIATTQRTSREVSSGPIGDIRSNANTDV